MAKTIQCPDCGHTVSKKAAACPSCGAPIKKKGMSLGCGLVILLGVVLFGGVIVMDEYDGVETPVASKPEITVDCDQQAEREQLIQKLINEGYFTKVEYRSIAEVWVTPQFMSGVDIDTKQSFISAIAAAAMCKGADGGIVVLSDAMSGNKVGDFSPRFGLDMK